MRLRREESLNIIFKNIIFLQLFPFFIFSFDSQSGMVTLTDL